MRKPYRHPELVSGSPHLEEGKEEMVDWVIHDALIVDGSGVLPFAGKVAIKADKIVEMGNIKPLQVGRRIDAGKKTVAPGSSTCTATRMFYFSTATS